MLTLILYFRIVILKPIGILFNNNFYNDSLILTRDNLYTYSLLDKSKLKVDFENVLTKIDTNNKILDSVKIEL